MNCLPTSAAGNPGSNDDIDSGHHRIPIVRIESMCINPVQRFGSQLVRAGGRDIKSLLDKRRRSSQGVRTVAFSHWHSPIY